MVLALRVCIQKHAPHSADNGSAADTNSAFFDCMIIMAAIPKCANARHPTNLAAAAASIHNQFAVFVVVVDVVAFIIFIVLASIWFHC